MKNHLIIFNLFASVPKNEWEYFKGWMCLNLASYSDRHSEWFLILWGIWTKEVEWTIAQENLSQEDVSTAHLRVSPDRLSIDNIRKLRMDNMQKPHENNLRSDFVDLIKEYLGLQQIRKDKLLVEKEALFFMARSSVPGTYQFYRNKLLKRIVKEPIKNAGLLKTLKHLLDIDTEYTFRYRREKPLTHNKLFNSRSVSETSWITEITEKSLPDLLNKTLSELQIFAFERLVKMVDKHPQSTDSESITLASSAYILVFFFRWSIKKEGTTLKDLQEGLSILDKTCPFLEKDLATNCIYAFHNIISFKLGTLSSNNHPDLKQLLKLQPIPYELALKHGSLAYLLIDFLNLMRIYMRNIDLLIWEKRAVYETFSLRDEPEIQELVSRAESTIAKYVPNIPGDLRPSVVSQLLLVTSFYRENQSEFEKFKAEYTTKYHGLSPLFNLNSEWHILKHSYSQLGKNVNDPIDSEYLSQQVRAFSAKCIRLKNAHKNYQVYLDQLSAAADNLGGYLRAKRKQKRLDWLERIKKSTTLLDKNWLIWKIEEYENENPA